MYIWEVYWKSGRILHEFGCKDTAERYSNVNNDEPLPNERAYIGVKLMLNIWSNGFAFYSDLKLNNFS